MSLLTFALRSIRGSALRSLVVAICVLVVACLSLATTLVVRGTQDSLALSQQRLGADMVVVPQGEEDEGEAALLMAGPTASLLAESHIDLVKGLQGVAAASPQLFLGTLRNPPCCSVAELSVVAFDPATDFTVQPWLKTGWSQDLGMGEAIVGAATGIPAGASSFSLAGSVLTLKGVLEPTGGRPDQTVFVTFSTARALRNSAGGSSWVAAPDLYSAIMVKLVPRTDSQAVSFAITEGAPELRTVDSLSLYGTFRRQMEGLWRGSAFTLATIWLLAVVLVGLIFSIAANERWREVAVQRALGATRLVVFRVLLLETALLALVGGLVGLALAAVATFGLAGPVTSALGVPFLLPSLFDLLVLAGGNLAAALVVVTLAALAPAWRASQQEPALGMRE